MDAYLKGITNMTYASSFISVGIDVGADFSFMTIAQPNQTFVGKPFKIVHSNFNSLKNAVLTVREASVPLIFIENTQSRA